MSRPKITYTLDASPFLAVAVCECGARVCGADRAEALRALASHEARGHPGSKTARDALYAATRQAGSPLT